MRKLARSFFWIDQEIVRSGLWIKLLPTARLAYIALAASVNREGLSLWGQEKLIELSGCSKEEWADGIAMLHEHHLIQLPTAGDIGITLLSLENREQEKSSATEDSVNSFRKNFELKGPLILKTTTTVELGDYSADTKDTK